MKRLLTFLLIVFFAPQVFSTPPYEAEGKVREDLTKLLGSLIIPEQFLVQVNSEVVMEKQKKVLESETIENQDHTEAFEPPELMPGFQLEFEDHVPKRKPSKKTVERYALEEVPKLKALRASISFDQALPAPAIQNAQNLVKDYLNANFPGISRVTFSVIPMLKKETDLPKKEGEEEKAPLPETPPKAEEEKPPSFEENLLKWLPWAALGLTLILLFINSRSQRSQQAQGPVIVPMYPPSAGASSSSTNAIPGSTQTGTAQMDDETRLRLLKNRVFGKIITNASAFAQYYEKLPKDHQHEIEFGLGGPAFDAFMDGLGVVRSQTEDSVTEIEERLTFHETQFEDFIAANSWRQKQFFGFLSQLNNDQLISLTSFETDTNVSLMLRFLKPNQSAFLLDNLSEAKRSAVLNRMGDAAKMPLAEITTIEKRVRDVVQRLPRKIAGGEEKQAEFWGSVLDHSEHSAELLEELEKTNPEISIQLKKYKFTLDDAATLPDEYLAKVIGETDNEELCLALCTCPQRTVELILEALPEKRRNLVKQMMPTYKTASREDQNRAKVNLTKRIREAMNNAA